MNARVSLMDSSIMPAMRGIWLIGCQFTGSECGMRGSFGSSHHGFGRGLGAPAGRLEVASIGNDMGVRQRRHASQILIPHLVSGGAELVDDAGDVDNVPTSTALESKLRQLALFMTSS